VRTDRAGGWLAAWAACFVGCGQTAPSFPTPQWQALRPGLEVARLAFGKELEAYATRFDPARYPLSLEWSLSGVRVPESLRPGYLAALNGGYFEPDLQPSGLLIDQGREVHAASGGSGVVVLGNRLELLRLKDYRPGTDSSALQAWPFLIEPGGADGIRRDDGKRSRRSAIALDGAGRGLLVAVVRDGVSLYQLMTLCRKLGATVALNLDGGPSTGFALGLPPGWNSPSVTEVSNALVLRAPEVAPDVASKVAPGPRPP
jgi:Phosphodiester glycosidase